MIEAPSPENPMMITKERLNHLPLEEKYAVLRELELKSGLVKIVEA